MHQGLHTACTYNTTQKQHHARTSQAKHSAGIHSNTHLVSIKAVWQEHTGDDVNHVAFKLNVSLQDLGIRLLALASKNDLSIPASNWSGKQPKMLANFMKKEMIHIRLITQQSASQMTSMVSVAEWLLTTSGSQLKACEKQWTRTRGAGWKC